MSLASYHCSTPGCMLLPSCRAGRGRCGSLAAGTAMAAEDARRRKLAELVAHHVFGHEQLHEDLAVVNLKGVADEVRHDRAIARPGADRRAMAGALLSFHLGEQPFIEVRPFFPRSTHLVLKNPRQFILRSRAKSTSGFR